MRIEAVILDMYGVVVTDPHGGLLPFVRKHFPQLGPDEVYPLWLQADLGEITPEDFWRSLGFSGDLGALERRYLDTVGVDADFHPVAEALSRRYRLALLSNDIARWNRYQRARHRLDEVLEAAVVSGEAGARKPQPAIYHMLLRRMKLAPGQCLFVDDRIPNLLTARALGMHTAHLHRLGEHYDGPCLSRLSMLPALLADLQE